MTGSCESGGSSLRSSLHAIKQAQAQLYLLTGEGATPTVISSRIQLCDVLLGEITDISANLARHIAHTRGGVGSGLRLHN